VVELRVRVLGRPAPQGSHEIGQNGYLMHSSNYLAAWRHAVNEATRRAYVTTGLTGADMPLVPNPRSVYLRIEHRVQNDQCRAAGTDDPTGVPDLDKLLRATIDGLAAARVFANDSQVVEVTTSKTRAGEPGADIIISDRPLGKPAAEAREITTMEYRLILERVHGRDEDGMVSTHTVFEMTDSQELIATAGLATVAAVLGVAGVAITPSINGTTPGTASEGTAAAEKTTTRKPRKQATPAASTPEPAAQPEPVTEAAPPAPAPQEAAQPVAADPQQPARVNPFARG
jgi:Holliday junction resolvase RusA-like endonuclease